MGRPTYNPSKLVRKRRHGFRARTAAGGHVLRSRRAKGRARLSAWFLLNKQSRILLRKDFVRVAKSGFYFKNNAIIVQCDTNNVDRFRVGFTASKKVGNAVVRNRCKRRMRAATEIVLTQFGVAGIDYVMIAKKATAEIEWDTLLESVHTAVIFLNRKISKKNADTAN